MQSFLCLLQIYLLLMWLQECAKGKIMYIEILALLATRTKHTIDMITELKLYI